MCAEALDEPRGWNSVHNVVVEGDGEAQVLPGLEFTIDQTWFGSDAADSELEGIVRGTDGSPVSGAKHPDGGDSDGAGEALPP